jgi:site-specific DNA-cytosine methylase
MQHDFTLAIFAGGSGLCGLGAQAARATIGSAVAHYRLLGSIDIDPRACQDFETWTGVTATAADLWQMGAEDVRQAFGGQRHAPDECGSSSPCKGFSRLLPTAKAQTAAYQEMNRLVFRTAQLACTSWEGVPGLFWLENVPGILSRGEHILQQTVSYLESLGYVTNQWVHDCGRDGGLAQKRQRFTLVARHPQLVSAPVFQPPLQRLKSVGEVLGSLPLPDDPRAGPMHVSPEVSWTNLVRLALIPAGGDWRDLPKRGKVVERLQELGLWPLAAEELAAVEALLSGPLEEGQARREVFRKEHCQSWGEPAFTVSGPGSNSQYGVADPRVLDELAMQAQNTGRHEAKYACGDWDAAARTVTGATRPGSGGAAVADPRLLDALGLSYVPYRDTMGVNAWASPGPTVRGRADVRTAAAAVQDPRLLEALAEGQTGDGATSFKGRPGFRGVGSWNEALSTVTGRMSVTGGNGRGAVADPRALERLGLGCVGRNGFYGVLRFDAPAPTVTGSLGIDNGFSSVADPRHAQGRAVIDLRLALGLLAQGWKVPRGTLAPAIVASDGCWHRPLTILEKAVLQGMPPVLHGRPLTMAGKSTAAWGERIGNGIPVQAMQAWGGQFLRAHLASKLIGFDLGSTDIWVREPHLAA